MHLGTAELAVIGDLTGSGLYERRTAERCHTIFFDANNVIRHPRHIGATCGRATVQDHHRG